MRPMPWAWGTQVSQRGSHWELRKAERRAVLLRGTGDWAIRTNCPEGLTDRNEAKEQSGNFSYLVSWRERNLRIWGLWKN